MIKKAMAAHKSVLLGMNPLADLILAENVDPTEGMGFYSLYNVRVSTKTYWDLHILINKPITDANQLKLIR